MLSRRAQSSLVAALLFFAVSSPLLYSLVDSLVGGLVASLVPALAPVLKTAQAGCPTTSGLVLHAAVFGLVTYVLMGSS